MKMSAVVLLACLLGALASSLPDEIEAQLKEDKKVVM